MIDYMDDNGCFWSGEDVPGVYCWYFVEIMGFCGCYSDDLFDDILNTLFAFENTDSLYYSKLQIEGPPKYKEMILHMMTDKGLLEHGSSVRGSWLTEKGKNILKLIREFS